MNSIFRNPYALAAVGLIALIPLRPSLATTARWQPEEIDQTTREQLNSSAFVTILGEVRASAADLMWVKTELYLHNGVQFKGHLNVDELTHTGAVAARHEHEEHHHDGAHEDDDDDDCTRAGTLIPEASKDYRGFIGTLQRNVQPWQDAKAPHVHAPGDELLPWYRMLTYSNPHHWRGYIIGTWWLARNPSALTQSEDFINEGVRNNPDVFQLHLMRGRVLIQRQAWTDALNAFRRAAALAEKIRPAEGKVCTTWSASDEEDYAAALRYIPLIELRKLNDPAAARKSIAAGLQRLPDDTPLKNLQSELR